MITSRHTLSDTEIMCLISRNNFMGWQCLYNKYALMMYVAILWVTNDKILAEQIMNLLFAQLKTNKGLLESKTTLCASLLHNTYSIAYKMLKINEWRTGKHYMPRNACPLLTDLVNDATDIAEADAKSILQSEVKSIREQYLHISNPRKEKKQTLEPSLINQLNKKTVANAN